MQRIFAPGGLWAAPWDAVDFGYRVIVATDGICSSSDEGHDALLTVYHQRLSQQIETADAETILPACPPIDVLYCDVRRMVMCAR
jgi:hypothetical protein